MIGSLGFCICFCSWIGCYVIMVWCWCGLICVVVIGGCGFFFCCSCGGFMVRIGMVVKFWCWCCMNVCLGNWLCWFVLVLGWCCGYCWGFSFVYVWFCLWWLLVGVVCWLVFVEWFWCWCWLVVLVCVVLGCCYVVYVVCLVVCWLGWWGNVFCVGCVLVLKYFGMRLMCCWWWLLLLLLGSLVVIVGCGFSCGDVVVCVIILLLVIWLVIVLVIVVIWLLVCGFFWGLLLVCCVVCLYLGRCGSGLCSVWWMWLLVVIGWLLFWCFSVRLGCLVVCCEYLVVIVVVKVCSVGCLDGWLLCCVRIGYCWLLWRIGWLVWLVFWWIVVVVSCGDLWEWGGGWCDGLMCLCVCFLVVGMV